MHKKFWKLWVSPINGETLIISISKWIKGGGALDLALINIFVKYNKTPPPFSFYLSKYLNKIFKIIN